MPAFKTIKGIIFVGIFLSILSDSYAQVPSYIPTNGLLAWYPFNGNANDAWVNAHNGSVNGATLTTDRCSQTNSAYMFDGVNDYISIPDNAANFRPQNFTISSWVLFNAIPYFLKQIIAKNFSFSTSLESVDMAYQGNNGQWLFNICTFNTYGTPLTPSIVISTGVWYNIVYQFDDVNNVQRYFLNGVLTASSTVSQSISYDNYPWTFGAEYENGALGYFWNGKIDDIGIWDRVLTPCEISQLYNTPCNAPISNLSTCAGNTISIVIVTPTTCISLTNVTYSLNPYGLTNTTGTFIVAPSSSQIYTTYITGLNANNSIETTSALVNVSVNPQPLVVPTYTPSSCTNTNSAFNLNLSFNPANPTPSYSVNWSNAPNGITNNQQTYASGVLAGIYYATVTAQGGCQATTTININPPPAQASFSFIPLGSNIYSFTCTQPTLNISTSNSSLSYTWTNTNTGVINGTSTSISSANLGTWTVSAEYPSSGCIVSHTFLVVQNTIPPAIVSISPSLQSITCSNSSIQTVTIIATPSVNITHSIVAGSGAITVINTATALFLSSADSYDDYIINAATGCSTHVAFNVLASPDYPTLQVTSTGTLAGQGNFTVGCNNHSLTVINIVNPNTNPTPGGALLFGFIPPNGGPSYTPISAQSTVVSTPGTWTVVVHSVNNNCEARVPVTIVQNTVSPNRIVLVPTQILNCLTPSVILTGYSDNNVIYNWNSSAENLPSQTFTVNVNSVEPNNTSLGNYTLTVTDMDNGCKNFTTITMQQNLYVPVAIISVTSRALTCITTSIQLSNSSNTGIPSITGFPNGGIVQAILWQGPAPQPSAGIVSSYVASTPGTYTMSILDSNNGCVSNTLITIEDGRIYPVLNNPSPPPSVIDCGASSETLNLLMNNAYSSYTYLWSGPLSNTFNPSTNIKSPSVTAIGIYTVTVEDIIDGCVSMGTVSVINGTLTGNFELDKTEGFAPLNVRFNNTSTSTLDNNNITSIWSYGNGLSDIIDGTGSCQTIYKQPGTYQVVLYTAKGNCKDTTFKFIVVDIPSKLEVPNVFSPNGDGINDVFFLYTANLIEIRVTIYDRWGNMTYELISYTGNIAWDGKTMQGKDASDGTYFYIITAKGKDDKTYLKKGNVTLVR